MLSLLLLPLQAAVILILHACFAFSRLVTLLQQVHLQRRPTTSSASVPGSKADIERDQARWKKTPRKLAVSFVPGTRWSSAIRWWKSRRERELDDERAELAKLVEDTRKLLAWCDQLGIEELSLYDEQGVPSCLQCNYFKLTLGLAGIFDRQAPAIVSLLSSSCTIVQPLQPMSAGYSSFKLATAPRRTRKVKDELSLIRAEVDSGCGVSDAGADGTLSPCSGVNLLISSAYRHRFASPFLLSSRELPFAARWSHTTGPSSTRSRFRMREKPVRRNDSDDGRDRGASRSWQFRRARLACRPRRALPATERVSAMAD